MDEANAEPVTTKLVVLIDETRATVVPVAAAVALAGNNRQALGALIVVENDIVQVVVVADPMVIKPD